MPIVPLPRTNSPIIILNRSFRAAIHRGAPRCARRLRPAITTICPASRHCNVQTVTYVMFGAVVACCMYVHLSICSMHYLSEKNSNVGEYKFIPLLPRDEEKPGSKPDIKGIIFADFDCTIAEVNCVTAMHVHLMNTLNTLNTRACLIHHSAPHGLHDGGATHEAEWHENEWGLSTLLCFQCLPRVTVYECVSK